MLRLAATLKIEEASGIINLRITLPVSFAGKIATANTLIKGANIFCRLGGKDAVPTCMKKGLIAIARDG